MGVMADNGSAFVIRWPGAIAAVFGCPVEDVGAAVAEVLGLDRATKCRIQRQMAAREYVPEVASLNRAQALRVFARFGRIPEARDPM